MLAVFFEAYLAGFLTPFIISLIIQLGKDNEK